MEATSGFEPLIKVLQTSALPLGHVAPCRYPIEARATVSIQPMNTKRGIILDALLSALIYSACGRIAQLVRAHGSHP